MPEIKNMFQKGVMNKDLDERLVPNGQYRDAMNIQVSTSEGSEVGTVQNILGNIRVDGLSLINFKCVGAIADEKNDVLYWFITSLTTDAIIEYRNDGTVTPILVDLKVNPVLKFDQSNIITGINIIDNLLFWTDDVNEPRKINIDTFKLNPNPNLTTHSDMYISNASVGPVTEDHITVIRKRPQKAPEVVFTESTFTPLWNLPNINFYGIVPGVPFTYTFDRTHGLVAGQDLLEIPDLLSNGVEFLALRDTSNGVLPAEYDVKLLVINTIDHTGTWNTIPNQVTSVEIVFDVIEILDTFINVGIPFTAQKVIDTKPIFEKELIRFGTRYKFQDGEYSAYSPFTQPVFLAGKFYFHPTNDPFNQGMESKAIKILIKDLIPADIPDDVVQVDILFKKERSTTIYSIDSIKPSDIAPANHWVDNTFSVKKILDSTYVPLDTSTDSHQTYPYNSSGQYEITTENIYAALPDNQMLRPWDNVPRKALAQEVTANRLVYGNYLQNYNLKDIYGDTSIPWIVVNQETRDIRGIEPAFTQNRGEKSIKSLRTYYLGVVYGDKYGRETPVLTSKDASINIPFDLDLSSGTNFNADKSLRLIAKLSSNPGEIHPEWASYYKYYIKQTTGEYYNLTLDRVYKSNDKEDNLWVSFPSSDRNKIQVGDYFSIKKQVDIESIVPVENKIKIIDIKNEAPESIKYEFTPLGSGGGNAASLGALFPSPSEQPGEGIKRLLIDKETWIIDENGLDLSDLSKSERLAVQFTIVESGNTLKSEKYFVTGFSVEAGGVDDRYGLTLRKTIEPSDSWVESSPGVMNSDKALQMTIYKIEQKDSVEFEGRFFVKVISNPVTQTYLIPSAQDIFDFQVLATLPMFHLSDSSGVGPGGPGNAEGIFNTTSTLINTTGNNITNTEAEWDEITKFGGTEGSQQGWFLDSTGFVATQQNNSTNLIYCGKGYKGNLFSNVSEYVNGLEGLISPTLGNAVGGVTSASYINGGPYGQNAITGAPTGARHWGENVIIVNDEYSLGPSGADFGPVPPGNWDNSPYQPVEGGGHWIHLSFACPGVDLGNDDFGPMNYDMNNTINDIEMFLEKFWENNMEGHRANSIWLDASGSSASANIDDNWGFPSVPGNGNIWSQNTFNNQQNRDDGDNQWNPKYNNANAVSVIDNLVPGSRFKLVGDDSNIYTIKDVQVKRLYNHTSWNPSPRVDPNGAIRSYGFGTDLANDNVANKMQKVLQFASNNNNFYSLVNSGNTAEYAAWLDFRQTFINFGKANNRRVCYILQVDKDTTQSSILFDDDDDSGTALVPTMFPGTADLDTNQVIRFIDDYIEPGANTLPASPAVFETEAKEDQDLNIYYEASDALPMGLDDNLTHQQGHLLGRIGGKVTCSLANSLIDYSVQNDAYPGNDFHLRTANWEGNVLTLNNPGLVVNPTGSTTQSMNNAGQTLVYGGEMLKFWREDGSYASAQIDEVVEISYDPSGAALYVTKVKLHFKNFRHNVGLPYYNCFSFGNGVESNRIRDDFNESYILNGVKASTVLEEPYEEERRKYGLIYSGVYNSISGVNNLNQFIQAEKITKDLMPSYGSVQKLYARDKDLITLCEDKIIRVYVDKDILYNADGNTQLLATNRVLGTAEPFRGNFGISKNPESFAAESFRAYFTDKQRGAVIRLSMDGLTPISDAGMHDYFRDNLPNSIKLLGSYDAHKKNYNLTMSVIGQERGSGGFVTQTSRNWVTGGGQQFYTTYIDLNDSTGVEVDMSVVLVTGSNTAGQLATMSPYSLSIPVDVLTISSISIGGGGAGTDRINLSGTLAGINGSFTLGALSGFDVAFEKSNTATITYNEMSKGWTSFKSFIPEFALSSVNQYYTINNGELWKHHQETTPETRNTFYNTFIESSVTPILNMQPAVVKNFNTLNYEGSQSRISEFTTIMANGVNWTDNEYYNLEEKEGWYVKEIFTDKQDGTLNEFIEKEGKWFNYIKGKTPVIDTSAFNFQGLGIINNIITTPGWGCTDPTATNFDPLAVMDDGSCSYDVYGCTDIHAGNYNPLATIDDGSCLMFPVLGCTDTHALNFDPLATVDDGSCLYGQVCLPCGDSHADITVPGCCDPSASNWNPNATCDDDSCTPTIEGPITCRVFTQVFEGCDDWDAYNSGTSQYTLSELIQHWYNILTQAGYTQNLDGTPLTLPGVTNLLTNCCGPSTFTPSWDCINGDCVDPQTGNGQYSSLVSCEAECPSIVGDGCTDITAWNYDPQATVDDGSCYHCNSSMMDGIIQYTGTSYSPTQVVGGSYTGSNPGERAFGLDLSPDTFNNNGQSVKDYPWSVSIVHDASGYVPPLIAGDPNSVSDTSTEYCGVDYLGVLQTVGCPHLVYYDTPHYNMPCGNYTVTYTSAHGCVKTTNFNPCYV
jgi:hypothetical protein